MKMIAAVLLPLVSLLAAGCGSAESTGPTLPESDGLESRAYWNAFNLPSHGVALEGYCPVAYFAVDRAVRGRPEYASTHEGVTYHFVSPEAKRAFDAAPAKYVPAYGGWCAFGMSVEDKFPADPTNFEIVDGRLMVFLRNANIDARELWNQQDEQALVKKADRHWRKVQK